MYYSAETISDIIDKLPDSAKSLFLASGSRQEVKKGEFLVRAGTLCRHVYLIESGVFRTYRQEEVAGECREVTSGFSFPGDFDTSPVSLLLQEPAKESIQALSDAIIISYDMAIMEHIIQGHVLNGLFLYALVDYTAAIESVLFDFRTLSARERYEKLLHEQPNYVKHIPLKYLASFLNVRESTLSRLRRA